MKDNGQKHIHFIGICGVAMSALGIAFKKAGWRVTGSDKGFYPPVSDNLKNAGIAFYPGWHPEKMGTPDIVVVGNVAGSQNPEWLHAQEKKIPYKSYPEVIHEYIIKKNSIVCAGTFGKSTNATLMTWILKNAYQHYPLLAKEGSGGGLAAPSYMFGGVPLNGMDPAAITQSEWSVVEGDEYKSSRWDSGAKFFHYAPTHLLLTSAVWDHADVYPTEAAYLEAFAKLIRMVPEDGVLVVSEKVPHRVIGDRTSVIRYGHAEKNNYQYADVRPTKNGISCIINHKSSIFNLQSSILGNYMADNMTGCFAMAHTIGVAPETIIDAVRTFKGVRRRLERRLSGDVTVFDDIAHSPQKAAAVLQSLRGIYLGRIFAVFEPNTGWRKPHIKDGYTNAFKSADAVVIPRLTHVKEDPNDPSPPMDGQELAETIAKTHGNAQYIDDDELLVHTLATNAKQGDVIVFLGSHGFRGMIENVVSMLS